MKRKRNFGIALTIPLLLTSCGEKAYRVEDYRLTMDYHDGFTILQWTDIHIGIQSDLDMVFSLLEAELKQAGDVDLIVITGDTFMGAQKWQAKETIAFFDSLNTPFTITYGNHDFQGMYSQSYINSLVMECQNAVFVDYADDNIFGYTNFFIDLVEQSQTKYRLYIIDSNNYKQIGLGHKYDVIHEDQLVHIDNIVKEYGLVDSLAFYHIPIYEFLDAYKGYKDGEVNGDGENEEGVSYGYKDTDAFERMKKAGVKGMFIGHDHINNTTLSYQDVILSYGVKSTFEIYNNKIGYTLITLDAGKFALDNVEKVIFDGGAYAY